MCGVIRVHLILTYTLAEEPLKIVKPLQPVTAMENKPSEFVCELSKPDVTVQWTKNGVPVEEGENVTVSQVGPVHTLTIRASRT